MSTTRTGSAADVNEEAIRAWDGPLFDRFVRFREIVTTGLGGHGEAALDLFPPATASGSSTSGADSAIRRSGSPASSAPPVK